MSLADKAKGRIIHQQSGTNTDDNIQLLRAACNRQKSAKHPVEFMQQRGFLL